MIWNNILLIGLHTLIHKHDDWWICSNIHSHLCPPEKCLILLTSFFILLTIELSLVFQPLASMLLLFLGEIFVRLDILSEILDNFPWIHFLPVVQIDLGRFDNDRFLFLTVWKFEYSRNPHNQIHLFSMCTAYANNRYD